jgi:hypothetical protein
VVAGGLGGEWLRAHDQVLRKAGVSREAIQQAARIAAVIHAVAATLLSMPLFCHKRPDD